MKKKMLIFGILSVLMLVTISFSSVIGANSEKEAAKESPLYKVRAGRVIGEKLGNILQQIKTKFLGERIYMMPFPFIRFFNRGNDAQYESTQPYCTMIITSCDKQPMCF